MPHACTASGQTCHTLHSYIACQKHHAATHACAAVLCHTQEQQQLDVPRRILGNSLRCAKILWAPFLANMFAIARVHCELASQPLLGYLAVQSSKSAAKQQAKPCAECSRQQHQNGGSLFGQGGRLPNWLSQCPRQVGITPFSISNPHQLNRPHGQWRLDISPVKPSMHDSLSLCILRDLSYSKAEGAPP